MKRVAATVNDVLDLVGETPLVEIRTFSPDGGATVWGKCEHLNPGGSVKDRIAIAMLDGARQAGTLTAGQTVVEPTSGNTGIGLALYCAVRGHPLVLTMPASMSLERRSLLEAYGVEIVLTEPERVMEGAMEAARRIAVERGAFLPDQFGNPENPTAHETSTGPEILRAMEGLQVSAFVASVGTGGTVSGVGRALKAHRPEIEVVAVEPKSSPVISGGERGPTKIQGIGAGFIPKNYQAQHVDRVVTVSDQDAWETKARLCQREGLLVGISAGANVFAACQVARALPSKSHVVTVLCDTGERYFSLEEHFLSSGPPPVDAP